MLNKKMHFICHFVRLHFYLLCRFLFIAFVLGDTTTMKVEVYLDQSFDDVELQMSDDRSLLWSERDGTIDSCLLVCRLEVTTTTVSVPLTSSSPSLLPQQPNTAIFRESDVLYTALTRTMDSIWRLSE